MGVSVDKPRLVSVATPPEGAGLRTRSDDELMVHLRGGLTAALRILAERHTEKLLRFCTKFLGDMQSGQDVVQQTWIQVWVNRVRYDAQGRFIVFVYTIARNLCRNELRRRRGTGGAIACPSDVAEATDDEPSQLDELLVREQYRGLLDALSRVPEAQREALLLRFDQELSYQQMAAVLAESESTLRSRVYYGIAAMRAALTRYP